MCVRDFIAILVKGNKPCEQNTARVKIMDPIHLPEKHLPEITFPRKTLGQNYIIPNTHFPERALSRNYISLNIHLPEITFS